MEDGYLKVAMRQYGTPENSDDAKQTAFRPARSRDTFCRVADTLLGNQAWPKANRISILAPPRP
jgi:hypothetical protein